MNGQLGGHGSLDRGAGVWLEEEWISIYGITRRSGASSVGGEYGKQWAGVQLSYKWMPWGTSGTRWQQGTKHPNQDRTHQLGMLAPAMLSELEGIAYSQADEAS